MSKKPTKSQADHYVAIPKIATAQVVWHLSKNGHRVEVQVFAENADCIFSLRAFAGRKNYSFALLCNNHVLRKFTAHAPHKIGGEWFEQPHKHVWDGETENREAYVPDDIDPKADINEQFLAFCAECNITLLGDYQQVAWLK